MTRILGVDYGLKRTGLSVTDELQIAVHPLKTIDTKDFFDELTAYLTAEKVAKIVFGLPTHADGNPTHLVPVIKSVVNRIIKLYPDIEIDYQDESYTSVDAKMILIKSGVSKKKRRDKKNLDLISAVLILQRYLKHIP